MKFSYQWLNEWVGTDLTPTELAELLTMSGLEVDEVTPVAAELGQVVVACIDQAEPHPDADRLRVCKVDDGSGELVQVVCGAPNARVGLVAPFAQVGAHLGDFKIRKAKLRGVESFGMLCSGKELGLGDDHSGLLELPEGLNIGDSLTEALGLDDATIDVDLTPNRADCLGIKGLAFEVAALTQGTASIPPVAEVEPDHEEKRGIVLQDVADCPRYVGRIIRGIDPKAPSPWWLAERLRRCGLRSISPLVDVTNLVLLELGQPMHAYDNARLSGDIVVRRARKGETVELLDGKTVDVDESILLITDDSGPIGLGGIMGGMSTAIDDNTVDVFLEAAWFRPSTIMGKARDLGMHTDASHRFERGVDPTGQRAAMERATELITSIAGGEPGPVIEVSDSEHLPVRHPVSLRRQRIARVLGIDVTDAEVERILTSLGMQVNASGEGWSVTPPGARFDIEIEEDLIEEIARVHGYNRIPATDLGGTVRFSKDTEQVVTVPSFRDALVNRGYYEAINFSFVGEDELTALHMNERVIPLANPLSADISIMRPALLPGLLKAAAHNLHRQQPVLRLMETGTVFHRDQSGMRSESQHLAGVVAGLSHIEQWGESKREVDFFDVKGDVEALLRMTLSQPNHIRFVAKAWAHTHPGRSAAIYSGEQLLGYVGQLHPSVAEAFEIETPVYCFELDLTVLSAANLPKATDISRFPSIRRDIAVELEEAVPYGKVSETIRDVAGEHLVNHVLFDVYRGKGVETGCKSLAMGLILQDTSRTLTDSEVDETMRCVIEALKNRHGAKLRG